MLYEGDVDFKKVLDLFSDGNYDGTSNTHVTLNKYLNALKIFGVKVKKFTANTTCLAQFISLNSILTT